jgi:glutamate 5-kinase
MTDKRVGTAFHKNPAPRKKTQMGSWIQAGALPKGKITVNACLADLLRQKKRISILEIGITDSVGNFDI